tara:strand:- start:1335 stop:1628 length:294 start_codon:yes stop_codon:yes gene_type:complete
MKFMNRLFHCFFAIILFTPLFVQSQKKNGERPILENSFSGAEVVRLADVNNDNLMDIAPFRSEPALVDRQASCSCHNNTAVQNLPDFSIPLLPDFKV